MTGSVLFLGKKDDPGSTAALKFVTDNFGEVSAHLGQWREPAPAAFDSWTGDYIVSYLSRWVVPAGLIARARRAAINFHPASPDYPGIGCVNFALYDDAPTYGATCHFMAPQVDTGGIIATKRFAVQASDTVETLLSRTYAFQLVLFYEVMDRILAGETLVAGDQRWTRKPFSRKEFNQLATITAEMSPQEIARRIRATAFGPWKPTLEVGGFTFELQG
jgi:methionyl-tRNA formyltransferase